MMSNKDGKSSLSKDFEELSNLVDELETGEVDLEESLVKFKHGVTLAKRLKARLAQIENEIEEVKSDLNENED